MAMSLGLANYFNFEDNFKVVEGEASHDFLIPNILIIVGKKKKKENRKKFKTKEKKNKMFMVERVITGYLHCSVLQRRHPTLSSCPVILYDCPSPHTSTASFRSSDNNIFICSFVIPSE